MYKLCFMALILQVKGRTEAIKEWRKVYVAPKTKWPIHVHARCDL